MWRNRDVSTPETLPAPTLRGILEDPLPQDFIFVHLKETSQVNWCSKKEAYQVIAKT